MTPDFYDTFCYYYRMNNKQQLLEELYSNHRGDPSSPLIIDNNTNFVFGEGNVDALIMLVGEAPGRDEDIQKRPFVGRAGQLLNQTLEKNGLKREDIYITNIIKARPLNNRTPTPEEISRCWPVLQRQIEIINPKIIGTLGSCALLAFLKKPVSITKQHGYAIPFDQFIVVPTFHPAFILRSPDFYPKFTSDINFITELAKNISK
jgi:DNA polymerase